MPITMNAFDEICDTASAIGHLIRPNQLELYSKYSNLTKFLFILNIEMRTKL